jgi:hypothetical protein
MFESMKFNAAISEDIGGVIRGCPIDFLTVPVTFKNEKGFVKLTGYEGSYSMNVTLEFRFAPEVDVMINIFAKFRQFCAKITSSVLL